jgi:hypothetical protein
MSRSTIYHCEVRSHLQKLQRGHWFFHTGQGAVCGGAGRDGEGRWRLDIHVAKAGKRLPDRMPTFSTLKEAVDWLEEYFEADVRRIHPAHMPKPSDL